MIQEVTGAIQENLYFAHFVSRQCLALDTIGSCCSATSALLPVAETF